MTNQNQSPQGVQAYVVRLGHYAVRVQGATVGEALATARRQLANELPRLWDVIHQADDNRFEVAVDAS